MKTQKGSVKKAGLGYIIGNYFIRGIGFLTLPIFSRLMLPEEFGKYNTFISYGTILFVFIGVAFHTSYKNAFNKYDSEFNNYVSNTLLLCLINTVLFMVLAIFIPFFFPKFHLSYLFLLVLYSSATAIIAYYNSYVSLFYRSASYVKIAAISAIGNIGLSLVLLLTVFRDDRSTGRIIGTVLPTIVIAIILIYYFFKQSLPNFDKKQISFALKYSIPLVPHGISQVMLSSLDRIMIASLIGNSQAGIYSFAYTIYSLISVTFSSLDTVWSPWFFQTFKNKDFNAIKKVANQYSFGIAIFTILTMLGAPELISILGSQAYNDSINIVIPIVIGGFFSFMYSFPAVVEYYFEKTGYIATGTLLSALINFLLNLFFLKLFGYKAAAYTTLVTYGLYFIYHYIISRRLLKDNKLYDTRTFILIIVLVMLSGIVIQIILPLVVLRWTILIILGLYFVYYLSKTLNINVIKNRK